LKNSRAVVDERQNRIVQLLNDNASHRVEELAETLGYSTITIRRDLQHLENEGLVKRQYGSAQLVAPSARPVEKSIYDLAQKAIAAYAASMVEDGDTIFANTGRTTQAFIAALKGRNITVVTNNLKALEVPINEGVNLMLTGGEIAYPALYGEFAVNSLKTVTASKCFLGVNGISAEGGMTTAASKQASINALMLARCVGEKIVITDSSKVGKQLNFYTGSLSEISCVITDSLADPAEIQRIRDLGVRVELMDVEPLKK